MKKIMLLAPLEDQQTGQYLVESIINTGNQVAPFDFRNILKKKGKEFMNYFLVQKINELKPEYLLVLKGTELDFNLFKNIKENYPDITLINWIFDVTIGGTKVEEHIQYLEFAKLFDYFFTSMAGSVKPLREKGVNAHWCPEGCHIPAHDEVIRTYWQEKKFGSDVSFIGTIGSIHPNRDEILTVLIDEDFDIKIWGQIVKDNPNKKILDKHTGHAVINDYHSIVAQSSKINIGIDGWPDVECSTSARVFRILCAGGFLLTTHTKCIEKMFTPGVHLDTFKTKNELLEKVYYYLTQHKEREKIARQGQELVKNKYTFDKSIINMLELINYYENK